MSKKSNSKKKSKGNLLSFLLCLLIAVAIWLYASGVQEKEEAGDENTPAVAAMLAQTASETVADIL